MKDKKSFVFHREWYEALKTLDDNIRLEVYDAIMCHVFEEKEIEISSLSKMAMCFITPQLQREIERYNSICESRKTFGRKGGIAKASKSQQKPAKGSKSKQNVASVADNDIILDTNVSMNNKEKEDTNVSKKNAFSYSLEFEKDFILYQRKGSKKNAYERWKKLSADDKEKMRRHIPFYLQSNERQYLKDFEGYINQRTFESPVTDRNGNILYDPDINPTSDYRPNGYYVRYMDDKNYYLYIGGYPDTFFDDGYGDDDRPDGAELVLNNARGILTWKATTKTWELTR